MSDSRPSAFPVVVPGRAVIIGDGLVADPGAIADQGMSLRDYFAAAVLPAIVLSNAILMAQEQGHKSEPDPVAEAYRLADEALRQREAQS